MYVPSYILLGTEAIKSVDDLSVVWDVVAKDETTFDVEVVDDMSCLK